MPSPYSAKTTRLFIAGRLSVSGGVRGEVQVFRHQSSIQRIIPPITHFEIPENTKFNNVLLTKFVGNFVRNIAGL